MQFDQVTIFVGHYLGGYPAALYYLPVMLTGLVIGKGIMSKGLWCNSNQAVISMTFIFFLLFLIFIPLNKMTATPPFIMLSILFSFVIFATMKLMASSNLSLERLEYLGRKPIRYWLMMYIVFLIPLWFYISFSEQIFPLDMHWYVSIVISLAFFILLYLTSHLIEYMTTSN